MTPYVALFKTVFQQHLQYRVAALAGALTNIAFGFFRLFLLTAFYSVSTAVQPMTLAELYSYIWFGQVLFGILPITGMVGGDAEEIRTGAVAYHLVRPISVFQFYYARVIAQRATALCTRSLIQLAILLLIFPLVGLSRYGLQLPELGLLPLLVIGLVMAILLSGAVQTLIYMSGFWTISTRGSASFAYAVVGLFSGLLVPLPFFPPQIRWLADVLPFRGLYDTPARLYNGTISFAQGLDALLHQGLWLAGLLAAGLLLARLGVRRLEVAGG